MHLNLSTTKPVCFLKVKTTGLDYWKDRIIELSIIKYETGKEPVKVVRKYNPGFPITEETTQFTGIQKETLDQSPTFEEKAKGLVDFLKDCDFVGFNIRTFDLPFLVEELNRAGLSFPLYNRNIVDLYHFHNKFNPSDFKSLVKKYTNKKITNEDLKESYLENSIELLNGMVNFYKDKKVSESESISGDIQLLNKYFNPRVNALDAGGNIILNEDKRPIFNFGKHEGKLVVDVCEQEADYFQWITNSAKNVSKDTINVIKSIVAKAKRTQGN